MNFPQTVEQIVEDRKTVRNVFHVDPGSDAKLLLIKGLSRLAWTKTAKVYSGIGEPYLTKPATLVIRRYRLSEGGWLILDISKTTTLLEGGRLSKQRIDSVMTEIDSEFGFGSANLIDIDKTVILGEDDVAGYIQKRKDRKTPQPR